MRRHWRARSRHSTATSGLKHGATGLLNTDWGDNGHQQMLAVSLTQFAYGAAASWNLAATHGWYDLLVTSEAEPAYARRFAGRLETGKDSITDPAMSGPAIMSWS